MNEKLLQKGWGKRTDKYAYVCQKIYIKFEEYQQLLGGNYSWHQCIPLDQLVQIYEEFEGISYKLFNGENPFKPVKTFHFVRNAHENLKYLIHIFKMTKERLQRSNMAVWCGFFMEVTHNLGYVRIFNLPCKNK